MTILITHQVIIQTNSKVFALIQLPPLFFIFVSICRLYRLVIHEKTRFPQA